MTPAREPSRRGRRGHRLAERADVEFALRALLGPAARDVAVRLPAAPTLPEILDAACGHLAPGERRAALRLLEAYFRLDPPVPASGDTPS